LTKGLAIGNSNPRPETKFRILVDSNDQDELIEDINIIVDASGTYGNNNWIGRGGLPALNEKKVDITYVIPNPNTEHYKNTYSNSTTAIIGSGASAITALNDLKQLAQNGEKV
jgi:hypothetical protein